jgi:hypothetical protein
VGALGTGGAFSFSFFFDGSSCMGVDRPLSPLAVAVIFCFFFGGSATVCTAAIRGSTYSGVPLVDIGSVCAAYTSRRSSSSIFFFQALPPPCTAFFASSSTFSHLTA